ncbi:unnamed protein product, partial [marine sediment metagenome]
METRNIRIIYDSLTSNLTEKQKKILPLIVILLISGTAIGGYSLFRYFTTVPATLDVKITSSDPQYEIAVSSDVVFEPLSPTGLAFTVEFADNAPREFRQTEWVNFYLSAPANVYG